MIIRHNDCSKYRRREFNKIIKIKDGKDKIYYTIHESKSLALVGSGSFIYVLSA